MGSRWTIHGIQFSYLALLILVSDVHGCCSLNSEGLALLEFRARVDYDPHRVLENWNIDDCNPCMWSGIYCVDGRVQMLELNGHDLEGTLAPELGHLSHLKVLVLSKNKFWGEIPLEIGQLEMLEVLDLSDNNLSGTIPAQIGGLQLLRSLLLCNNYFEGSIPSEIGKLHFLTELQFDQNLTSDFALGTGCVNRKFGDCIWHVNWNPLKKASFLLAPIKGALIRYLDLLSLFNLGKESLRKFTGCCSSEQPSSPSLDIVEPEEILANPTRRKLLEESSNLIALPANGGAPLGNIITQVSSRSSGSFPAVPGKKPRSTEQDLSGHGNEQHKNATNSGAAQQQSDAQAPADAKSGDLWKYIIGILIGVLLIVVVLVIVLICRCRAAKAIGPWKNGLSGQLQKAFVTGVPKLNRVELETACEDFSNIITSQVDYTTYKGTLSSGVEIAVGSTAITSLKDWSKRAELGFRKRIDTLSRVNHKNFVNLIGYCEEDEPFTRMMVFEYAPNGSVFEHLHVKGVEHLDWNTRMRVIMGTAYCLQYMHDLNPPVCHSNITAKYIFLTDDYAAKLGEVGFWEEFAKSKAGDTEEQCELPPLADPETNIYCFGLSLLEIITGKLPYSEKHGPLLTWAAEYMNDKKSMSQLIDPTLHSFNDEELGVLCEVIQECVQQDARKRPTITEIIEKLNKVLDISPQAAVPRLSPLWWAELEILSAEAP